MKKVNRFSTLLLAAAVAVAGSYMSARADDATTTTTTTTTNGTTTTSVTQPAGTPTTISGKVSGLNFSSKSFWIAQDNNKSIGVYVTNAKMQYNGQDANIYRLMASPQVTVSGNLLPGTSFTPGGLLYADTVTINSGPTVRLQPSSYTQQAQPPFGPNELAPASAGTTTTTNNGGTGTAKPNRGHKTGQGRGTTHRQ